MKLSARLFTFCILGCIFLIFFLSSLIRRADIPLTNNDVIRQYQWKKIATEKEIHTVIVGDSSAGNAIDAAYFSELFGHKTVNVALTAGFGLEGSYNMIRHVLTEQRPHNIILIHALRSANETLSPQAFFDTLGHLPLMSLHPIASYSSLFFERIKWAIAPKQIGSYIHFLWRKPQIAIENDFLKQAPSRFSNKKKKLRVMHLNPRVSEVQRYFLSRIDALCKEYGIRCIYLHGPLHEQLVKDNRDAIISLNAALAHEMRDMRALIPVLTVFASENDVLGDAEDHIDVRYKQQVTKGYYEALERVLIQ